MKYRIISDTHFGHQLLLDVGDRQKGYEDKIHKSLSNIPASDTLIHLGDILIGDDAIKHDKYIKTLKCKKILVKGNHDRKTTHWYNTNGRDFVVDSFTLQIFGKEILFVHIPTEETMKRANEKENRIVIHGHYHMYGRKRELKKIKHILYSCEYENMQARTIQYLLSKYQTDVS